MLDQDLKIVYQQRADHQQATQNIISISANENFEKLLVNCSDRVMRLYSIDYEALLSGKKTVLKLIDGFF
ncbi:MAG: hypothetical protein ACK55Z_02120, partial [bacterium]